MDFVFHVLNGKIYFFFVNTYESCVSNRRFLQHARGLGTVRELGQRACMRYPDSSGSRPWCSESLVWWACQSQLRSGKGEVWPSQKSDRLPSPSSMSTEGSNEHCLDHCTCSKSTGPNFSTAYWRRYAWARRSGTLSERTYFFHGKLYWTSGRTQKLNRVVNTDIGFFFLDIAFTTWGPTILRYPSCSPSVTQISERQRHGNTVINQRIKGKMNFNNALLHHRNLGRQIPWLLKTGLYGANQTLFS